MTFFPQTRYTWRIVRPMERDVVGLYIFKYIWDPVVETKSRAFLLQLDPEPHWHEYHSMEILPSATVEFDGLDLMYLMGGTYKDNARRLPDFDLRQVLEDKIESKLKSLISDVMGLEPAIEFDDAEKG